MHMRCDAFLGARAAPVAMLLIGLLVVPPTLAQDANDRKETEVARAPGSSVGSSRLDEAPLDAAIRSLMCLEARQAVEKGRLDRQGQQWILTNGHRCEDDRLLFDALGF